jgi:hypothetical protein
MRGCSDHDAASTVSRCVATPQPSDGRHRGRWSNPMLTYSPVFLCFIRWRNNMARDRMQRHMPNQSGLARSSSIDMWRVGAATRLDAFVQLPAASKAARPRQRFAHGHDGGRTRRSKRTRVGNCAVGRGSVLSSASAPTSLWFCSQVLFRFALAWCFCSVGRGGGQLPCPDPHGTRKQYRTQVHFRPVPPLSI